jgi:hypothetical protein
MVAGDPLHRQQRVVDQQFDRRVDSGDDVPQRRVQRGAISTLIR